MEKMRQEQDRDTTNYPVNESALAQALEAEATLNPEAQFSSQMRRNYVANMAPPIQTFSTPEDGDEANVQQAYEQQERMAYALARQTENIEQLASIQSQRQSFTSQASSELAALASKKIAATFNRYFYALVGWLDSLGLTGGIAATVSTLGSSYQYLMMIFPKGDDKIQESLLGFVIPPRHKDYMVYIALFCLFMVGVSIILLGSILLVFTDQYILDLDIL